MLDKEEHSNQQAKGNAEITKRHKRCWSDLPPEILELICSNLVSRADSSAFSWTCQSWRHVATHRFPPPLGSVISVQCPYLMTVLDDGTCKFYQPLHNETYQTRIPELKNTSIRYSYLGWLLMSRGTTLRFFYHPLSRSIIDLPDLRPNHGGFHKEYFWCPRTSSPEADYLVIGFELTSYEDKFIQIATIRKGEVRWTYYTLWNGNVRFDLPIKDSGLVLLDGTLYCLGFYGDIGKMDLVLGPRPERLQIRWTIERDTRLHYQSFMLKWDERHLLVAFFPHPGQIVLKRRHVNKPRMWEAVDDLGDRVLYLGRDGGCFLEKSIDRKMANRIYLPKFHGETGLYYSLVTGKYHSVAEGDDYSSKGVGPDMTDQQRSSTWIKLM